MHEESCGHLPATCERASERVLSCAHGVLTGLMRLDEPLARYRGHALGLGGFDDGDHADKRR